MPGIMQNLVIGCYITQKRGALLKRIELLVLTLIFLANTAFCLNAMELTAEKNQADDDQTVLCITSDSQSIRVTHKQLSQLGVFGRILMESDTPNAANALFPEPPVLERISAEEWKILSELLVINAQIIDIESSLAIVMHERKRVLLELLDDGGDCNIKRLAKSRRLQLQEAVLIEREAEIQTMRDTRIEFFLQGLMR